MVGIKLVSSILLMSLVGCSSVYFQYDIVARHQPDAQLDSSASLFSLRSIAVDSVLDPLIESNIHSTIKQSLIGRGWHETTEDSATFVFISTYGIFKGDAYSHYSDFSWSDKGGHHQGTGSGVTRELTSYHIKIGCFASTDSGYSYVWSVDCYGDAHVPDIVYAGEKMIPFAMSIFPKQGNWRKKLKKFALPSVNINASSR